MYFYVDIYFLCGFVIDRVLLYEYDKVLGINRGRVIIRIKVKIERKRKSKRREEIVI